MAYTLRWAWRVLVEVYVHTVGGRKADDDDFKKNDFVKKQCI